MVNLVMSLALVCGQAVAGDDDVAEAVDAINAAIEEARWKLEFYCTCRFRAAWGKSQQEAIAKLEKASVVHGVMARMGDLFRASGRSESNDNWPANFECIESSSVKFNWYLPAHANYGLERQRASVIRSPRTGPEFQRRLYSCATFHLDPLSYGGWVDGKLIHRYPPEQVAGKRLVERLERPSPTELVFHEELYHNDTLQSRVRITLSTKYKPPVLVKREYFSDERHLGAAFATESLLEAEGFVEVRGGWLPCRMRVVFGPMAVNDMPNGGWCASEWVSDDLGKRPPRREDFIITLPEHVEVRGLKNGASVGKVRRLDMNTLTLEQVVTAQGSIDGPRRPVSAPAEGQKLPRLLFAVVGVFVLAGVGIVIWYARTRRRVA